LRLYLGVCLLANDLSVLHLTRAVLKTALPNPKDVAMPMTLTVVMQQELNPSNE